MDYYMISTDEGRRKKFAYGLGVNDEPSRILVCDICKREREISSLFDPKAHLTITLTNDYYADFMWYYTILITERVKSLFEINNITGYYLKEITTISGSELNSAQKREVRNAGAKLNRIPESPPKLYRLFSPNKVYYHENSGMILVDECKCCGYAEYASPGKKFADVVKQVIKKESIPDTDLFNNGGIGLFCNDAFREFYESNKLTGLIFEQVEVI